MSGLVSRTEDQEFWVLLSAQVLTHFVTLVKTYNLSVTQFP